MLTRHLKQKKNTSLTITEYFYALLEHQEKHPACCMLQIQHTVSDAETMMVSLFNCVAPAAETRAACNSDRR